MKPRRALWLMLSVGACTPAYVLPGPFDAGGDAPATPDVVVVPDVATVCTPGVRSCVSSTTLRVCSADGLAVVEIPCGAGTSCRDGACAARGCTPGEASCASATARRVCLLGGQTGGVPGVASTFWSFDPTTGRYADLPMSPERRAFHALMLLRDGRLVAVAGLNEGIPTASVSIYSFETNAWR